MKPKHQRLIFISIGVFFLCVGTLLILQAFRDNLIFFYSPSELAQATPAPGQVIRIGGLVETGSLTQEGDQRIRFRVTDGAMALSVTYQGMLPSLFREGQGVVAQGTLTEPELFEANTILAKHDEKYMPREVADALKRTGHWKEGENGAYQP